MSSNQPDKMPFRKIDEADTEGHGHRGPGGIDEADTEGNTMKAKGVDQAAPEDDSEGHTVRGRP
jgi:hypothetical protein